MPNTASHLSLAQLEERARTNPNSVELHLTLALKYLEHQRVDQATGAVKRVAALYPAIAALNVNRIHLGAVALAISSVLFLLAEWLYPPNLNLAGDLVSVAAAVSSKSFIASQLLFLPLLALLSTAVISIYKLLSTTRDNHLAFWAMVTSLIGIGLFLPAFGIRALILPAAGQLYLQGQVDAFQVYVVAYQQPWAALLQQTVYVLLLGLSLFTLVIWRSGTLPKWAAALYGLGWALFAISGNELSRLGLLAVGLLMAGGGLGLARGLWQQAPLQAGPQPEATSDFSASLIAARETLP